MTIVLPAMTVPQEEAWLALIALAELVPTGWCLVGGQMVHLHCAERGVYPNRPTDDGDAVLDVRAEPDILQRFTQGLIDLGFGSAGVTMEGHEHRWVKGDQDVQAQIDVLIPSGVGETARARTGATGSTTLETPGAQQALNRAEFVEVSVAGAIGRVPRPSLAGAIVMKAAAYSVTNDSYRDRHLHDLTVLGSMVGRRDDMSVLTKRDRSYLRTAVAELKARPGLWAGVEDGARGVEVLDSIADPAAPGGAP